MIKSKITSISKISIPYTIFWKDIFGGFVKQCWYSKFDILRMSEELYCNFGIRCNGCCHPCQGGRGNLTINYIGIQSFICWLKLWVFLINFMVSSTLEVSKLFNQWFYSTEEVILFINIWDVWLYQFILICFIP